MHSPGQRLSAILAIVLAMFGASCDSSSGGKPEAKSVAGPSLRIPGASDRFGGEQDNVGRQAVSIAGVNGCLTAPGRVQLRAVELVHPSNIRLIDFRTRPSAHLRHKETFLFAYGGLAENGFTRNRAITQVCDPGSGVGAEFGFEVARGPEDKPGRESGFRIHWQGKSRAGVIVLPYHFVLCPRKVSAERDCELDL